MVKLPTEILSGCRLDNCCSASFQIELRARAANDTTRAQINNIPSKSHVIPLLTVCH